MDFHCDCNSRWGSTEKPWEWKPYFCVPDFSVFQNDLFFLILRTDVDIVRFSDFCLIKLAFLALPETDVLLLQPTGDRRAGAFVLQGTGKVAALCCFSATAGGSGFWGTLLASLGNRRGMELVLFSCFRQGAFFSFLRTPSGGRIKVVDLSNSRRFSLTDFSGSWHHISVMQLLCLCSKLAPFLLLKFQFYKLLIDKQKCIKIDW